MSLLRCCNLICHKCACNLSPSLCVMLCHFFLLSVLSFKFLFHVISFCRLGLSFPFVIVLSFKILFHVISFPSVDWVSLFCLYCHCFVVAFLLHVILWHFVLLFAFLFTVFCHRHCSSGVLHEAACRNSSDSDVEDQNSDHVEA